MRPPLPLPRSDVTSRGGLCDSSRCRAAGAALSPDNSCVRHTNRRHARRVSNNSTCTSAGAWLRVRGWRGQRDVGDGQAPIPDCDRHTCVWDHGGAPPRPSPALHRTRHTRCVRPAFINGSAARASDDRGCRFGNRHSDKPRRRVASHTSAKKQTEAALRRRVAPHAVAHTHAYLQP